MSALCFFNNNKERLLIILLSIGIAVFLCAPWVLTSNTPYQKLIISFFWLPALIHLFFWPSRYRFIDRTGMCLFMFASMWFSLIIILHSEDAHDLLELKVPIYIGLTLLGFFAVAGADAEKFTRLLLCCAVLGGFGAWASWIYANLILDHALFSRQPAVGLWNKIIPAAQASGALMLVLVCLGLKKSTKPRQNGIVFFSLTGYGMFLLFNQTRGVWVALAAALLFGVFLSKDRKIYIFLVVFIVSLALLYIFEEKTFIKRGGSQRSELWLGGLEYAWNNILIGLGFEKFWIYVASQNKSYDHSHNMYIDLAIRFGLVGLASWVMLWGWAFYRAFQSKADILGRAALVLLVYSSVAVMTDGIPPWVKPSPGWFVTWLPLALVFSLGSSRNKADSHPY